MLLLLFAALSIDPRITFPYELTVFVQKEGRTYSHTETYRNQELCETEEKLLDEATQSAPNVFVSDCEYIGLV